MTTPCSQHGMLVECSVFHKIPCYIRTIFRDCNLFSFHLRFLASIDIFFFDVTFHMYDKDKDNDPVDEFEEKKPGLPAPLIEKLVKMVSPDVETGATSPLIFWNKVIIYYLITHVFTRQFSSFDCCFSVTSLDGNQRKETQRNDTIFALLSLALMY